MGWVGLDYINWVCILFATLLPAVLITLGCCLFMCLLPCLCCAWKERLNEEAERGRVVSAIVRRHYNAEDFKQHTECSICTNEFLADDEVTPLPCNTAHYFHSACIAPWLKTNNTCPLCRKQVDAAGFDSLRLRLGLEDSTDAE